MMENLPDFDDPSLRLAETPGGGTGALGALEDGLAAAIPGLRILDRELELATQVQGGASRIDLAGVDGEGRLVLVVLLEDGSSDRAALAAMDLLALAQASGPLLARHLEVAESGEPRCVLVAEHFGPRLMARLGPVRERLDLLRLCSLRSARGLRTYLVTVDVDGEVRLPALPARCSSEEFLEPLAPEPRRVVELLLARVQRMDSEFDLRFTVERADWAFHGRDFLTLEIGPEGLVGRALPAGTPVRLDGEAAVERLVEQAFGVYVRLLGLFEEQDAAEEALDDESPAHMGSVLTAEEIAAFQ